VRCCRYPRWHGPPRNGARQGHPNLAAIPDLHSYTLAEEGGDSNDAHDPGGRTHKGIIQREYDRYRRQKGLPLQSDYLISDFLNDRAAWEAKRAPPMATYPGQLQCTDGQPPEGSPTGPTCDRAPNGCTNTINNAGATTSGNIVSDTVF
jgi:Glycosyl hydrolase 108